jgi:diguanylate cyclase (GGDEF)-like protein
MQDNVNLTAFIDGFDDPVVVIDRNYRVVQVNAAFRDEAERGRSSPIGEYCHNVLNWSADPCFNMGEECPARRVWETSKRSTVTRTYRTAKGQAVTEVSAIPIRQEGGHFDSIMLVLKDVSERVRVEQHLRERNRELTALNTIISSVSPSVSLRTILDDALEKVLDLASMEGGGIRLVDEKTGEVTSVASKGLPEELVKVQEQVKPGEVIVGQISLFWRPVVPQGQTDLAESSEAAVKRLNMRSFVVVPMKAKERIVGSLILATADHRTFTNREVQFLTAIAGAVGIATENARLHEEVGRLASTDGLTSLYNHRHFYQRLDEEISHATRYHEPLSLLFIDVDKLKAINDTFGHLAGDNVLREIARLIRESCRKTDTAARYGGDEFSVILPHTSAEQAGLFGQRLLRTLEAHRFSDNNGNHNIKVVASIGVASLSGPSTPEDLVRRADQAAYRAKQLQVGVSVESTDAPAARADTPSAEPPKSEPPFGERPPVEESTGSIIREITARRRDSGENGPRRTDDRIS